MIRAARHADAPPRASPFAWATLLTLGFATSIDALAVGVSFSLLDYGLYSTVCTIGLVTFALCVPAVRAGARLGVASARRAGGIGGATLIAIGAKILIEHHVKGI
jgi:putative Mn2+ efflux pump MntP